MTERMEYGLNRDYGPPDPEIDPQFYEGVPAKRLFAFVIDVALVWGVAAVIVVLTLGLAFLFIGFLVGVIDFIYRVTTITGEGGTFGMRLMGIELREVNGERPSSGTAFVHTLLFYVAMIFTPAQVLSVILMAITPYGRGLHDMPLGTAMINRPL